MQYRTLFAAALIAAGTSAAQAQGFSGGTLGLEYSNFADSDVLGSTSYYGAVEFDVFGPVGIALDLSGYNYNNLDDNGSNLTAHFIYHLSSDVTFGLFVGRDSFGDSDADIIGIEGDLDFGQIGAEGYLASFDSDGVDATVIGADGAFAITDEISVIGGFDHAEFDSDSLSKIEIGGEYTLANGPVFYGTIGNVSGFGNDENFISIGAEINFGASNGTTFETRTILDVAPGD